jgi:4,5-dihydroxyphthalate decarboxylase
MHSLLVIKNDVLAKYPGLARSVYDALCESKAGWLKRLRSGEADAPIDKRYRKQEQAVGGDPLPFGLDVNRPSLEALMTYAVQQKMLPRPMPLDDLFVNLN